MSPSAGQNRPPNPYEDDSGAVHDHDEDFHLTTWNYAKSDDENSVVSDGGRVVRPAMLFTLQEEQEVVSKLDRRLVWFVALLYLLSFLDRSSKSPKRSCLAF